MSEEIKKIYDSIIIAEQIFGKGNGREKLNYAVSLIAKEADAHQRESIVSVIEMILQVPAVKDKLKSIDTACCRFQRASAVSA
jgi:hypothetical protein